MAVSVATHPAGKQRVAPDAVPAWWLVDESGDQAGQVLAGPFADQVDADWAALSSGLSESAQSVHGVQRLDGGIVRRQSPEEKAWLAELGDQLDRLPEDWDELLTDDDALTTLVVEVAAALVEAGLPVHDCAGSDSMGGVCLTPGPHYGGVVVSWHQHAPHERSVRARHGHDGHGAGDHERDGRRPADLPGIRGRALRRRVLPRHRHAWPGVSHPARA